MTPPSSRSFISTGFGDADNRDGGSHHTLVSLQADEHIVALRKLVRERATEIRLSLVDQTKLITAASEIARNAVKYGTGGEVCASNLDNGERKGIRLVFTDKGPGITNIEQAMTDGYTTGNGLGLGLGGAKRLVDEFGIRSSPDGTTVTLIKWKK